jgi:hypothetical protein
MAKYMYFENKNDKHEQVFISIVAHIQKLDNSVTKHVGAPRQYSVF